MGYWVAVIFTDFAEYEVNKGILIFRYAFFVAAVSGRQPINLHPNGHSALDT